MTSGPSWHGERGTRKERGYGPAWDKLRLRILKRDHYVCQCEDCLRLDRLREATHVDHRISKAEWLRTRGSLDGCDDPSNLRAMNKDCHALKTQRERGYTPKAGADANGFPLDPGHPWFVGAK